jgi:hypothetical protein
MNFLKKNWQDLILILYVFVIPIISFASDVDTPSGPPVTKLVNPLAGNGVNDLQGFIKLLLEGALKIGIPIVALAVIYSGFLFVFARGNSEKLGDAKKALFNSIIGAAILLGSWAIAEMISITVTGLGK